MQVELVGGPMDGFVVAVAEPLSPEYRVPDMAVPTIGDPGGMVSFEAREERYVLRRRSTGGQKYVWARLAYAWDGRPTP